MDDYIDKRAESYFEAQTQSFYSDQDVERVCLKSRLSLSLAPEIVDLLEHAAKEWLGNFTVESKEDGRMSDDLSRLAKAAGEFSDALGETTREAWDAMFDAAQDPRFAYEVLLSVVTEDEFLPGPISVRVDDPEGSRTVADISISDLRHVVSELGDLSTAGQDKLRKPGRGRRESHALKTWVRRMFELWDEKVGQSFTAGHLEAGEATTAASAFCIEAFRVLDPDMPPQRVHTEMRKVISFANRFHSSQ